MKQKTLLVVDDEPINLAIMESILADSYTLVTARSGAEARDAVVKHKPSLALLDIGLPDIDGYELCRQIRQLDPTGCLQVIFVTGHCNPKDEAAGFEAGAVDYILKPIVAQIVRARVSAHLAQVQVSVLEQSYREAITMLGQAGHFNDTDTGVHIWRMAAYSRALAVACGWDDDSSVRLELAATMHDTGKLGVPQAILRKPGPLNEEEWIVMRTHPQIGFDILSTSDAPVFKLAAEIALYHHEKWDGSGYPAGLKGQDIPQSARIVAMADVFDALSMKRPYKEPWPLAKILVQLEAGSGTHFDPELVVLFNGILPQILAIQSRWNSAKVGALNSNCSGSMI
ncbi:MAG: HD domain-containing phosphohydrolase [Marinobacter sp.]